MSTRSPSGRGARLVALLFAALGVAIAPRWSPAAAQDGSAAETARSYYDALLSADSATAHGVSNGMLPIDFGRIDGVELGDPDPLEACPELPQIPAGVREGADTGAHRRTLDSIAGVLDSLFRGMRGAVRCAEIPTTLIVAGSASQKRVTVEFPTSVRLTTDGWRVEAFGTGTRAAPAVLRTMGFLLRDLGDALEGATEASAGG